MAKKTPPPPTRESDVMYVRTEQLLLDPENPRLAAHDNLRSQKDLLEHLWLEMALDEIALSIAANGFFPEEALFVIPKSVSDPDSASRQYIVVEGNRRLAAVKLLLNENLRNQLGATGGCPIGC